MKIVVIGGTGLIGSQVVRLLLEAGHDAAAASKSSGVDVITGDGLAEALEGAQIVVDVTNSPAFDEQTALDFFRTSTENLLAAEEKAGVGHHVALSIVGVDLVPELGYYRAKVAQEALIGAGPIPYSIVRATQFFEFVEAIVSWTSDADAVRLPSTLLQPVAAADVARTVADVAIGRPLQGILDLAGPDVIALDELGRLSLAATGDARPVVVDESAGTFGGVAGTVLTAGPGATITKNGFRDWLSGR